ncbi:MAG: PAS domain S-box protein [Betaproteobacteria bacterium]|nr:PAS domain S-box protein [Betaproteobacteria bacterium]
MIRVLHIEDDRFDQELVRNALEEEPGVFSVTVVSGLEELRRLLENPLFDCIVSDIHLGSFDGLQVLSIARERAPHIPLIFLTGTGSEEIAVEAMKGGAADYIIKTSSRIIRLPFAIRLAIERAKSDLDRRRAEEALRFSEERFRLLIEKSSTGMYVTRDGRFVYANPRLEALLGYESGELMGRLANDLVVPEDLPVMKAAREKLRSGESSVNYAVRVKRRDGGVILLGVQGLLAEFEGTLATIGMAQDITERKRAQEQIASYLRQLETSMRGTLRAVANMVELRDPYTAGHQRRVGAMASVIAKEMGMPEDKCQELELTSLVHDVGKIAVPAEILSKPGALSEIEREIIKTHAEAGYEILKEVEFAWPLATIIRQHHERLDGSGYPRGLRDGQIHVGAQIIAVADVLEAIASHRPYRPSLGIDRALEEIQSGRGILYGADVVDSALRLFREKGYRPPD